MRIRKIMLSAFILSPLFCHAQMLDVRIDSILNEMTSEEKIYQLTNNTFFTTGDNERLGIPGFVMSDGPHGVRYGGSTSFPVGIAMAATWDREMAQKVGEAMGREFQASGKHQQLGPCTDLCRDPRNGRSPETGGEDPFLAAQINANAVIGIQKSPVIATAKHFNLVNKQEYRNNSFVTISERNLHEHYGLTFRTLVQEGGVMSVMNAYNLINGVHCSENNLLLDTILRQEWGFPFYIVSDWGAVHNTQKAFEAGTDICMGSDDYTNNLPGLVSGSSISMSQLDSTVGRVLKTKIIAGMLDFYPPPTWGEKNTSAQRQICLEAGEKSIVLLKNEESILPIDTLTLGGIALIGPSANKTQLDGFGSSEVETNNTISPRTGIESVIGANKVNFVKGCDINSTDTSGFAAARAAAASADFVIFVGGLDNTQEGEGYGQGGDRKSGSVDLPGEQQHLIKELAKVNPNLIVILESGGICAVHESIGSMKGLIYAFYPGQEGGAALANVLFGKYNPAGRLPVTMPSGDDQLPEWNDDFDDDFGCGYRWYDEMNLIPEFPFGYGLSYTTFVYSNLAVSSTSINIGEQLTISMDVTNTGSREGEEVVQLFISNNNAELWFPKKELKDFKRISLNAGETKAVSFVIDAEDFYFWNEANKVYDVLAGSYTIKVGGSSDNLPLSEDITLSAGNFYPDLKLTRVLTLPRYPLEGQEVSFYALIQNKGAVASPPQSHKIDININGSQVVSSDAFSQSIPAGGMRWVSINSGTWTPGSAGIYTIEATVNGDNSITEYISDNNTYSTQIPVYDKNVDPRSSIAYKKPVYTSSNEDNTLVGSNMVDGDFNSRWASAYSDNQNFVIDLLGYYQIETIILDWEAAFGKEYTIEVSMDSVSWETAASTNSGDGAYDTLSVDIQGRFIRFNGISRATVYGYSLYEFLVYGSSLGIEQSLSSLKISPHSASVDIGSSIQFTARGSDQYNNSMAVSPSWEAGGGSITTSGLFTASQAGNFTVSASQGEFTATADIVVTEIDNSISVNSVSDIRIYPNPFTSGSFRVNLPEALQAEYYTCKITDLMGRKVFEKVIPAENGQLFINVEIITEPGVYLLYLEGENTSARSKIIKK